MSSHGPADPTGPPTGPPTGSPTGPHDPGHGRTDADDRALAILAHLSAPIAALVSAGFLSVLGPLLIWLLFKDRSALVRRAAAGAFNFNVSFWILYLVSWLLILTLVGAIIGVPLMVVIFVVSLVLHVLGAMRASRGEIYDYPFQIRILS